MTRSHLRTLVFGLTAMLAVACGSSDDDPKGTAGTSGSAGSSGTGGTAGGAGSSGTSGSAGSAGLAGSAGSETGGTAGGGGTGGGCGDMSSDPANCGVCGHDCQGGECVDGACQPVVMRNNYYGSEFVIDGTSLYYVKQQYGNDPKELMTGPLTPLATDSSLGIHDEIYEQLHQAGSNIFWNFTGGEFPNYTNQISFMNKAGGTVTAMDDDVDDYFPAADRVFILVKGALYSRTLSGGTLTSLVDQTPDWVYYLTDKSFSDGDSFFVARTGGSGQGSVLFRIPSNGTAGSIILDLPGWVMDMTFSTSTIYGLRWIGGPYASCSSSPSSIIWSAPKAGGTPNTLVTHPSLISNVEADDSYIYFADKCDRSLWRVPTTGGATEKLAEDLGPDDEPTIMLDDDWVYFVNTETDQLLRIAK